jgi:hypothetical protein
MNTASKLWSHTRTNRGAHPSVGSEFTTEAATLLGNSAEFVSSPCVSSFGPVVSRARITVHEVARAEKLVEWQRARSVDHAGLEVE